MSLLLLSLAVVALCICYILHRRETRRQWEEVERIVQHLVKGSHPPSFIFHGEPVWQRLGLGLEELANQRDRLQRQIHEEEFNLQVVLASVEEGIAIVDTERRIRLVNNAFLHLFSLQGSPLGLTLLHALRNAAVEEMVRLALAGKKPISREITVGARTLAANAYPMQRRGQTKTNEDNETSERNELEGEPFSDARGSSKSREPLGVAVIFRDITRVTQLEQVRRDFVANVSHELRTPLSIFQGYVEMLLDTPDLPPSEVRATLDILQKHSHRLNLLVEDLLSIARLESRREQITLAPVQMERVLAEIAEDWKLKFAAKKVDFRTEFPAQLPMVMACRTRIEQIINNLLENALSFTPEGGEVGIYAGFIPPVRNSDGEPLDATARFGEIEVRVRDTGSGIPAGDLPHIFERFYRADKARNRERGGTGLGLSIVKHLAQAHGGRVTAESLYGRGTTITLRLPVAPLLAGEAALEG